MSPGHQQARMSTAAAQNPLSCGIGLGATVPSAAAEAAADSTASDLQGVMWGGGQSLEARRSKEQRSTVMLTATVVWSAACGWSLNHGVCFHLRWFCNDVSTEWDSSLRIYTNGIVHFSSVRSTMCNSK